MRKLTYLLSLLIIWGMIVAPLKSGAQEKFPKGQEKYEPYVQNPNFTLNRSTVFSESFNEVTFPPIGWTRTQLGAGTTNWARTTTTYAGAGAAWHNWQVANLNNWLITPPIVLDPLAPGDEYILTFYERNQFMTWYEYSGVWISTGSGDAGHVDFVEIHEANVSKPSYAEVQINLSSYAGNTIYLAFVYQGNDAHTWFIDEVSIGGPPPPPPPPPTGADCTDPIIVDVFPYMVTGQTNCGFGNNYSNTCLDNYDGGEDIHYQFTLTEEKLVTITMDPKTTTWTGMLLADACPPPGSGCIAVVTGGAASPRVIEEVLPPGVYYIMIDTWPTPNCIPNFDLTITLDDPPPPLFAINPENWNFGTVAAGGSADKVFTIQNAGSGTLTVSSLDIQNVIAATGEFSITSQPESIELGAGETADITVTFAPNSPGDRSVNLLVATNVNDEYIIPLNGNGIDLSNQKFSQPAAASGSAAGSYLSPTLDYESADNFWDIDQPIKRVRFTGMFTGTVNPMEPFFIRFYEYVEGYVPGLQAPVTGTYVLALKDQFDHWNWGGGSFVSVYVNGVPVIENAIMLSSVPNPKYYTFEANAGDEISTIYTPGSWSSENYYAIMTEQDNPATILAEQGGTWNTPGASTPGNINPGSIIPLEPDWNNPVSTQYVSATQDLAGTTWAGYNVYNLMLELSEEVNLEQGWFSVQYDGINGTAGDFFWLPGLGGDGLSFQRTGTMAKITCGEKHPAYITSGIDIGFSRSQMDDDRAFTLYGPSTLIPLSNWALYLGILLMITFIVIRFRRMI